MLSVERIGDEIELAVADDGVGMAQKGSGEDPEKKGADYVAIFVRPAWRHDRPVAAGRNRHDRQDTSAFLLMPPEGTESIAA